MAKGNGKVNYRVWYRRSSDFNDMQMSIQCEDFHEPVKVDIGPMRDDGTLIAEQSITIDRSDMDRLAMSWLDTSFREKLQFLMRNNPPDKRNIEGMVYCGATNITYNVTEGDRETSQQAYEDWYNRYHKGSK